MNKVNEIINKKLVVSRKRPKIVKNVNMRKIKRFLKQHKKLWEGMSKY